MSGPRVAVVLATVAGHSPRAESLAGFRREVAGRGEVVEVGGDGRLVPELWRDGLRSVSGDADYVAFSTTQMVPRIGWLEAMLAGLDGAGGAWGVGGSIEPGHALGAVDRAVFLLRFLSYGPSLPDRPSGENALYRRDRLRSVADSWSEGFWEAEVHRRAEAAGATWAAAPGAVVTYEGETRLATVARARWAHARRFGAGREVWRALAAPIVPAVLLARAWRGIGSRGLYSWPWLTALPNFLMLAGVWAGGEAVGVLAGPRFRASDVVSRRGRCADLFDPIDPERRRSAQRPLQERI